MIDREAEPMDDSSLDHLIPDHWTVPGVNYRRLAAYRYRRYGEDLCDVSAAFERFLRQRYRDRKPYEQTAPANAEAVLHVLLCAERRLTRKELGDLAACSANTATKMIQWLRHHDFLDENERPTIPAQFAPPPSREQRRRLRQDARQMEKRRKASVV